ncbi:BMP family ABC transporter substrate-binding protein [Marispirochaeta sp.]|uniref:BMP family ABC transporter substrate-binding protein n=1 Tax=Marispirochaeta sp. TaxID=2038653 RepID=UPI0029C7DAB3|nr:BMP family ABC transporter substrate-binding protein [Marispirochaeta sp.]
MRPKKEDSPAVQSIAVFVPGVVAGSPTYEMMVKGVQEAAKETPEVEISVIEGGVNQGEWLTKVSSLAASGRYDLIVTSNPAMPEICAEVSRSYPEARFLILDGHIEGNPSIFTFRFDQKEQGYLAGYFAGLVCAGKAAGRKGQGRPGSGGRSIRK